MTSRRLGRYLVGTGAAVLAAFVVGDLAAFRWDAWTAVHAVAALSWALWWHDLRRETHR